MNIRSSYFSKIFKDEAGFSPYDYLLSVRLDESKELLQQTVAALGHSFTNYVSDNDATCTKNGTETATCDRCSETDTREIPNSALGHSFTNYVLNNDATCTKNGTETATCDRCDETDTREIPNSALGHNWGAGVVTKAPTCIATGVRTYTCSNCGETYTETIPMVAHTNKTTTTKATISKNGSVITKCSVCGKVSSTKTIYCAKTITLSATSYTYNGKVKTPSVTIKDSKGNKISSSNYTLSYSSGRKYVGKYSVKITFKGNYSGSVTKYFYIKPTGTSISSLSAGSKRFIAKWSKKSTQVTGYQIQFSTSSKFTSKTTKTSTVSSYKTTSRTIGKLSGKKKYYVRVRTYKTVGKTKYYSSWSKVKSVTTKK